jgi:hypothetical protein
VGIKTSRTNASRKNIRIRVFRGFFLASFAAKSFVWFSSQKILPVKKAKAGQYPAKKRAIEANQ